MRSFIWTEAGQKKKKKSHGASLENPNMNDYPPKNDTDLQKSSCLALCLQPPAEAVALLDLPHVCKGTKSSRQPGRGGGDGGTASIWQSVFFFSYVSQARYCYWEHVR